MQKRIVGSIPFDIIVEMTDVEPPPPPPAELSVVVTSPADEAVISEVTDTAFTATSTGAAIAGVQMRVDGVDHGTENTQVTSGVPQSGLPLDPASFSEGPHVVDARVRDINGVEAVSAPVDVIVDHTAPPPPPPPPPSGYPAADPGATYPMLIDRSLVLGSGTQHLVTNKAEFDAALASAVYGDVIRVTPGAEYVGAIHLPLKSGTGRIHIVSSELVQLPVLGENENITQADAVHMPEFKALSGSTVTAAFSAHGYKFVGCIISSGMNDPSGAVQGIVDLGTVSSQRAQTMAEFPDDIHFDRCWIKGTPLGNIKNGVVLNIKNGAVYNSLVTDIHARGAESHGIQWSNTPGPICAVDNRIECAGMGGLSGGEPTWIFDLHPSDIEWSRNYMFKPLSWKFGHPTYAGILWSVKNGGLEAKHGIRMLIDGNTTENVWVESQHGSSQVLSPRNDANGQTTTIYPDGWVAPPDPPNGWWSTVKDVTFQRNRMINGAQALSLKGTDDTGLSGRMDRLVMRDNLGYGMDYIAWGGAAGFMGKFNLMAAGPITNWKVYHNTIVGNPATMTHAWYFQSASSLSAPAEFRDNIFTHGNPDPAVSTSGFSYEDTSTGTFHNWGAAITKLIEGGGVFLKNVLIGPFPAGVGPSLYSPHVVEMPADISMVKFVNPAAGDYRLAADSPYKNAGSDGTDIGARI